MAFWVDFDGRRSCCIEANCLEAARIEAAALGTVVNVRTLPYPAEPNDSKNKSGCPSFCYTPIACAGRSCCPKNYACSE